MRRHDYVFFVTFGQRQADHEFDEGITSDGVFRWQSQPSQRLSDSMIKEFDAAGGCPNAQTEVGNYSCFDCFASEVGSFGSRSLRFSESGTRLVTPDP